MYSEYPMRHQFSESDKSGLVQRFLMVGNCQTCIPPIANVTWNRSGASAPPEFKLDSEFIGTSRPARMLDQKHESRNGFGGIVVTMPCAAGLKM
jgi:hypothetical protein